jgi:hypothetical protein
MSKFLVYSDLLIERVQIKTLSIPDFILEQSTIKKPADVVVQVGHVKSEEVGGEGEDGRERAVGGGDEDGGKVVVDVDHVVPVEDVRVPAAIVMKSPY